VIRVIPGGRGPQPIPIAERLRLFDAATTRQRERDDARSHEQSREEQRGWTREELYWRARSG
jgi:hypothetical protein